MNIGKGIAWAAVCALIGFLAWQHVLSPFALGWIVFFLVLGVILQ